MIFWYSWESIKSSTTTAYHPQANGLVECMHHQLKAALKARSSSSLWTDDLLFVLLGMRSLWREGPETSPSELVYGTTLCLPGQLVPGVETYSEPDSPFVRALMDKMSKVAPVPSRHHDRPVSHIPQKSGWSHRGLRSS